MMWAEQFILRWRSAPRGAAGAWMFPRQPVETAVERLARHAADRRHLIRLDDRLLADVGLTRDAVERGVVFRDPDEYGLAIRGRDHMASFRSGDVAARVFFDQSPRAMLGYSSYHLAILAAH